MSQPLHSYLRLAQTVEINRFFKASLSAQHILPRMANQLSAEELQKLKAKIKRAYAFFDKDGTGSVIQEYVSPCLHDALPGPSVR